MGPYSNSSHQSDINTNSSLAMRSTGSCEIFALQKAATKLEF